MSTISPEIYAPIVDTMFDGITINPGINGAGPEDHIMITTTAFEKIKEFLMQILLEMIIHFVSLHVAADAQEWLQIRTGQSSSEGDRKHNHEGVNFVFDQKSVYYLMGVTLDYIDDVNGSGFVFNNPNNENTCGCSH